MTIKRLTVRGTRYALAISRSMGALLLLCLLTASGCDNDNSSPTLQSLQITPAAPSVAAGGSVQLTATATYSNSTHADITSQATWQSSNVAISTIGSNTGKAAGVAAGTATVTVSFQGQTTTTTLTVTPATLVSIQVTPTTPSVAAGATQQFTATGTYTDKSTQDMTSAVTWASSNGAVASISNASGSNGLASSSSAGTTNISAAMNSVTSGTATLTVTAPALVSLSITPAKLSVLLGNTVQYTAQGAYTDNSTADITSLVTWTSSTTSVATISSASGSAGAATAHTSGHTTISASLSNISSSTDLTVVSTEYAYVTDYSHNTINVFTVNNTTGVMTAVTGGSFPTGGNIAFSVASTPNHQFLYVANRNSASVAGFTIDPTTGLLTAISGSPFNTGGVTGQIDTFYLTVDPTGTFVVTTNYTANSISVLAINQSTGALSAVPGSPFAITGTRPNAATFNAQGNLLYVTDESSHKIEVYSFNPSNGQLTAATGSPYNTGSSPRGFALSPSGSFAYVANAGSNNVQTYSVGSDGALTSLSTIAAGSAPWYFALTPNGKFGFVTNNSNNTVSAYTVNTSTGALSSAGPIATGTFPAGAFFDPTDAFVFVANNFGNVSVYSINQSTGVLTQVPGSPFGSGLAANSIAFVVE